MTVTNTYKQEDSNHDVSEYVEARVDWTQSGIYLPYEIKVDWIATFYNLLAEKVLNDNESK